MMLHCAVKWDPGRRRGRGLNIWISSFLQWSHSISNVWLVPWTVTTWVSSLRLWRLHCHLSLLADLAALCGAGWSACGSGKVPGDDPVLSQPADAALHHPQDLLQPAVQRWQVGLGEDGLQQVLLQGLPHHVAQPVLRLGQQLEAQQRGALDPESTTHETSSFLMILTDWKKLTQDWKQIPSTRIVATSVVTKCWIAK